MYVLVAQPSVLVVEPACSTPKLGSASLPDSWSSSCRHSVPWSTGRHDTELLCTVLKGVVVLVRLLLARYDSSPHQVTAAAQQHDRLQIEL